MEKREVVGVIVVILIISFLVWNRFYITDLEKVAVTGKASSAIGTVGVEINTCGNLACEAGECTAACSDCSLVDCCGDGNCTAGLGENVTSCFADCFVPEPEVSGSGGSNPTKNYHVAGSGSTLGDGTVFFTVDLIEQEIETRFIDITNPSKRSITFEIDYGNLESFISSSQQRFTLNTGDSTRLTFDFKAPFGTRPGLYTGTIRIYGDGILRNIRVMITVEDELAFFDFNVSVASEDRYAVPGESIDALFTVFGNELTDPLNVDFYYSLIDFNVHTFISKEEILSLDSAILLSRSLRAPSTLKEGLYAFYGRMMYLNETHIASDFFEIASEDKSLQSTAVPEEKPLVSEDTLILWLVILVVVLTVLNIIIARRGSKKRKR